MAIRSRHPTNHHDDQPIINANLLLMIAKYTAAINATIITFATLIG
jgi:hypothetical protein